MRLLSNRSTRSYAPPALLTVSAVGLLLLLGMAQRAKSDSADTKLVLGEGAPGSLYAITIAVKDPAQLQAESAYLVSIADSQGTIAEKWLHAQDLDLYLTMRPRTRGNVTATLHGVPDKRQLRLQLRSIA